MAGIDDRSDGRAVWTMYTAAISALAAPSASEAAYSYRPSPVSVSSSVLVSRQGRQARGRVSGAGGIAKGRRILARMPANVLPKSEYAVFRPLERA